jgi:hypothetical protein
MEKPMSTSRGSSLEDMMMGARRHAEQLACCISAKEICILYKRKENGKGLLTLPT